MREILFRGKTDKGKWVQGYFIKARWYLDNSESVGIMPLDLALYPHSEFSEYDEVIPETVGQYTGLTDKNGKKIYEGDILDCGDRVVYVMWHDFCGLWDSIFIKYKGELQSNGVQAVEWKYRAVIIGNIHDNPELLKNGE